MKAFLIAAILLSSLLIATSTSAGDKGAVVCNDPKNVKNCYPNSPPKTRCPRREGCRGPPATTPHTSTP
ncbi:hypothetical protein SLE2022_189560 [Rubroshorea leprosula]